jgi:hypothetical protein
MKTISKIISVLVSAVISSLFLLLFEHFSFSTAAERAEYYEYYDPYSNFILYTVFQIPIYIILGLPVTYLIDFICKKLSVKTRVSLYFVQLFLFSVVAILLPNIVLRGFAIDTIVYFGVIPVLTYFHVFHVLVMIRNIFPNKKSTSPS